MARVRRYLYGGDSGAAAGIGGAPAVRYFTDTRAQAHGVDNSTKLSTFLAVGALSPRVVHRMVERCDPLLTLPQSSR